MRRRTIKVRISTLLLFPIKQKIAIHRSLHIDPYGVDEPSRWTFNLRSLPETHIYCHKELRNRFRNINILAVAGLLVLISALLNHLVLFIGQQQRKQRQQITYTGMGASRKSMFEKSTIELLALVLFAFLCSLCFIEILFPFYEQYTAITQFEKTQNGDITNMISKHNLVIHSFFFIGCSLVIFLFASLPVLSLFIRKNKTTQHAENEQNKPALFFRRCLITGQIIIGSLFFLSALTLYRQVFFMENTDKGITVDHILQIELTKMNMGTDFAETIKTELLQNPDIKDVTLTVNPVLSPSGDFYGQDGLIIRMPDRDFKTVKYEGGDKVMYIEPNFVSFFNIPIIEGENMEAGTEPRMLINETGARTLGIPFAINTLTASGHMISAVIKDYKYCPMQYPIQKIFFMQRNDSEKRFNPYRYIYIKYLPEKQKAVTSYIRDLMNKQQATSYVSYTNLKDIIDGFNEPEETIFKLFCVLTFLSTLISSFGIYCLVSLTAEQRRKEIAIRKVNGATVLHILNLFCREYLLLVIAGNLIAFPIGYFCMVKWLETYAYHISLSVWSFICVFLVTCLIVLFAVTIQICKNYQLNPSESLKE